VKNLSRALPVREQGRRNRRSPLSFLEEMKSLLDTERKKEVWSLEVYKTGKNINYFYM
jgi:hypothetical protein